MTLYFDTKAQFLDSEAISTIGTWHFKEPLFAVASYSQDKGGSVTIFDDAGEPLRDVTYPIHAVSQATALCWHPEKKLLLSGWENGEIHAWCEGRKDFASINGLHKAPIMLLEFSEKGGRMITADSMGVLTGWRCDNQGQFLTMFTHDLRDPLLNITFRKSVLNPTNSELTNLAKAAVAGDETALDTLTSWRPRTAARNLSHSGVKDNHCFYVGTQSGILYYINQTGTCTEILRNDSSPIIQTLWHPKRDSIVALMEDMTVGNFMVESTGTLSEMDRVKLSGRVPGHNGMISWAGDSLAIITGDLNVRIWDIETSDSFLLSVELPNRSNKANGNSNIKHATTVEVFTCISYCTFNKTLCAGTNHGNMYTWKKTNQPNNVENENLWQLTNITSVRGTVKQCIWGISEAEKPCLMVNCVSNVYILKEQPLLTYHSRNIWAVQKSPNQLIIEHCTGRILTFNSDLSITNLCLNENNLILTNGRSINVYKFEYDDNFIKKMTNSIAAEPDADPNKSVTAKILNNFTVECQQLFLYDQNIIVLQSDEIKIFSLRGVLLQEMQFRDNEGKPIGADLTNHYLTVFTMNGFIKIFDISKHEPKLVIQPKSAYDLFDNFGEIIQAKCSNEGNYLLLTIATASLVPDGFVYVWDIEKNDLAAYDFLFKNDTNKIEGRVQRLPINIFWDTDDNRIFGCEACCINASKSAINIPESEAFAMFYNEDTCLIKELERIPLANGQSLINVCSPHVITLQVTSIVRIPLRDFVGLENCDESTRLKVLDFSLHVANGNMDKAFSCIRSLQSEIVWENLTKMCVQTGRLDVAKVCLGHLNRASSVRAVRKAIEDTMLEDEAKIAVLAIELNMIDEAEKLYKKCGRYDLLNHLYQACGRYEDAIQLCEQYDRVHLKNTYYKYAEWLRDNGEPSKALEYYEKCVNATHNITQILMEDPIALKKYMQNTNDPKLLNWWAQYIESTGDMETAFKIYQKAEDYFSQIRILCFLGHISKADNIARHSGNRAACYHLARHYESIRKFAEAIQFYTRAQTYGNAVRICKENDLENELWNVANSAPARDKASAALYFEESGDFKKAVELYHRAGMLHKAVEMAFASQQPEILQVIASELDYNSDPELVSRCATFFQNIDQHQKAVHLLASARQFEKSLEICSEHGVPITEQLAEMLTPTKEEINNDARINILKTMGEILQEQGDYHLATKKFTQSGDKIRAMKSLLKSGDTEKIIFFAGMSRQKEVYIMAANYLQSLDWQNDSKLLKNIITFYSKGQAYDLLANFYANCAQIEIDTYRDFEKAYKALQEAARYLAKVPSAQKHYEQLQSTIIDVRKVFEIQEAMERREYQTVVIACRQMLLQPERPPLHHYDLLAFLVEGLILSKQYSEALINLRELNSLAPDWCQRQLIEKSLIERLAAEYGIEFSSIWNNDYKQTANGDHDLSDGDEISEEL